MKIVKILVVFIFFQFQSSIAQRVCFVNETKLLKEVPNYIKNLTEVDSIKKEFIIEITDKKSTLDKKIEQLIQSYGLNKDVNKEVILSKLSETDKKRIELFQEENQLLEKQAQVKEEEYQAIYNEKVGLIIEKVNKIVQDYCKKNKIEVLFKIDQLQPAIAYYDESKDVTEVIIKLVKEL